MKSSLYVILFIKEDNSFWVSLLSVRPNWCKTDIELHKYIPYPSFHPQGKKHPRTKFMWWPDCHEATTEWAWVQPDYLGSLNSEIRQCVNLSHFSKPTWWKTAICFRTDNSIQVIYYVCCKCSGCSRVSCYWCTTDTFMSEAPFFFCQVRKGHKQPFSQVLKFARGNGVIFVDQVSGFLKKRSGRVWYLRVVISQDLPLYQSG